MVIIVVIVVVLIDVVLVAVDSFMVIVVVLVIVSAQAWARQLERRQARDGRWYTMQESPGQRLESLGTPPLKLSDAEEENLEEAAALFSLLGVQVLGSSLLARRTAAVAATGPRGQLAAVLIRLTFDTT